MRDYFYSGLPKKKFSPVDKTSPKKKLPCILCGSILVKGENIKSEEFKGKDESKALTLKEEGPLRRFDERPLSVF